MADLKFSQGKAGLIKDNKTVDFKVLVPLKYFKVLVSLKYFKVLVGLRSQFKYSDFTGITKPSCIKKTRLFKKHSDFEIPVKSSVSYLNYYVTGDRSVLLGIFFCCIVHLPNRAHAMCIKTDHN